MSKFTPYEKELLNHCIDCISILLSADVPYSIAKAHILVAYTEDYEFLIKNLK